MSGEAEYLRARDVARLTGVSIRTARRWIADEIIPSVKLGGSRLVARADLERLLCPAFDPAEKHDDTTKSDIDFNATIGHRERGQTKEFQRGAGRPSSPQEICRDPCVYLARTHAACPIVVLLGHPRVGMVQ